MTKKTTEPTEPTPDEIIAARLEAARIGITEDLGVREQWSATEIAALHNAARRYASRALAPAPLHLPRPSLVNEPLKTSPPVRTRAQVDGTR